jgi:DNA invertase Pin-like site-specific DNA recombinase
MKNPNKEREPQQFGYIRVSAKDQNEDRQVLQMQELGINPKNIFIDKRSGKDFNRKNYIRMKKKLAKGDTLFVLELERLGRNYDEILEEWRELTKVIQCDMVILDMPLLDTRQKNEDDLISKLIADMVLQILAYVAQKNREYILRTQAEGIKAAHLKGVKFGRPEKPIDSDSRIVCDLYINGEISCTNAAERLGIPKTTFLYRVKKRKIQIEKEEVCIH